MFAEEKGRPGPLASYRILSPTCGLRVSPLILGSMSVGQAWSSFMGSMDKEQSFKLLDAYHEAGGNFIDTASNYQNEESETWIGEWMAARQNRDRMIIATKFTSDYQAYKVGKGKVPNHGGNHKRCLHMALRDSLAKLQTDWIDILYVHWWDYATSIEEVMDGLHNVVQQGKVLYLGVSDTPAWIVSAANTYARQQGKTPFCIYQGRWNVLIRDMERDIIPMARQFGMAIAPWEALGGGKFQSKKSLEQKKKSGEQLRSSYGPDQSDDEINASEALAHVAAEHGIESITAVALAYVMSKTPYVFPIVGGKKVEHLQDNIKGLGLKLTKAQVEYLESVKPFDVGFPGNLFGMDPAVSGKPSVTLSLFADIQFVRAQRPIGYEDN